MAGFQNWVKVRHLDTLMDSQLWSVYEFAAENTFLKSLEAVCMHVSLFTTCYIFFISDYRLSQHKNRIQ